MAQAEWRGPPDHDWYQFLRTRPAIDEVNLCQPNGSRAFRVLQPGEPFRFSSTAPSEVPGRPEDRPNRELLEWHAEARFLG